MTVISTDINIHTAKHFMCIHLLKKLISSLYPMNPSIPASQHQEMMTKLLKEFIIISYSNKYELTKGIPQ